MRLVEALTELAVRTRVEMREYQQHSGRNEEGYALCLRSRRWHTAVAVGDGSGAGCMVARRGCASQYVLWVSYDIRVGY